MRSADKNFGAEGPLVIAGEGLECSWLEDVPGSSDESLSSLYL